MSSPLLPAEWCCPTPGWAATCTFLSDAPAQSGLSVPQSCIQQLRKMCAPDGNSNATNTEIKKDQGKTLFYQSCALAPINPGSIFFQVPGPLCLKFQYISAGAHYSHVMSHALPRQISPSFFRKDWILDFPFLDCSSPPPSQIQELQVYTVIVGYCSFPKQNHQVTFSVFFLEGIPEIKIPTKHTLILLPNTPTEISAMQLDHGIYTLAPSLTKTEEYNSTPAKHPYISPGRDPALIFRNYPQPQIEPTCCGWRSQMIVLILFRISSMNGMTSPTWTWTKCRRHFCAIFMKVSQAMSWTPSWVSKWNQGSYCFVFFPSMYRHLFF